MPPASRGATTAATRADGPVSLAVVAGAIAVALGAQIADPLIGLAITIVILRITWQSCQTVRPDAGPGHHEDHTPHLHPHPEAS